MQRKENRLVWKRAIECPPHSKNSETDESFHGKKNYDATLESSFGCFSIFVAAILAIPVRSRGLFTMDTSSNEIYELQINYALSVHCIINKLVIHRLLSHRLQCTFVHGAILLLLSA